MDSKEMMGGIATAGKVAITGLPAAVLVDVALQASDSGDANAMRPMTRDVVRAAAGAALTLGALMLGAPADYAAGPLCGNVAVAGVEGARRAGWAARLRDQYQRARQGNG